MLYMLQWGRRTFEGVTPISPNIGVTPEHVLHLVNDTLGYLEAVPLHGRLQLLSTLLPVTVIV